MKIKWVNHAGFLLETAEARLLTDPWLEGYVFDNSWSLLSPTEFKYEDFADVTHIWFSHEHPDHFFPPNLKSIPASVRKQIKILFQPTRERRVVEFCREMNFKEVIELPLDWYSLSGDLSVYCQPVPRGDSWLAIRTRSATILDINDCIYASEEELQSVHDTVGPIDALITQFSYASWWGNKEDKESWRGAARDAIEKVKREIAVLAPKYVIPAASFVFFCHEENAYMNEHVNQIETAVNAIASSSATPVVLYPGDCWTVGDRWDSGSSIARYRNDYEVAFNDPLRVHARHATIDQLTAAATKFVADLRRDNSKLLTRRIPAALIDLPDLDLSMQLDLKGLRKMPRGHYGNHDISLGSSALLYCLRFPWGGETLTINGRFQVPAGGDRNKFFRWFSTAHANSRGITFDRRYYARKLLAKLLGAN